MRPQQQRYINMCKKLFVRTLICMYIYYSLYLFFVVQSLDLPVNSGGQTHVYPSYPLLGRFGEYVFIGAHLIDRLLRPQLWG